MSIIHDIKYSMNKKKMVNELIQCYSANEHALSQLTDMQNLCKNNPLLMSSMVKVTEDTINKGKYTQLRIKQLIEMIKNNDKRFVGNMFTIVKQEQQAFNKSLQMTNAKIRLVSIVLDNEKKEVSQND